MKRSFSGATPMRGRPAMASILWPFLAGSLLLALVAFGAPAVQKTSAIAPKYILQHLNRMISWYQHVNAINQATSAPQNMLLQDNTRAASRTVLAKLSILPARKRRSYSKTRLLTRQSELVTRRAIRFSKLLTPLRSGWRNCNRKFKASMNRS